MKDVHFAIAQKNRQPAVERQRRKHVVNVFLLVEKKPVLGEKRLQARQVCRRRIRFLRGPDPFLQILNVLRKLAFEARPVELERRAHHHLARLFVRDDAQVRKRVAVGLRSVPMIPVPM